MKFFLSFMLLCSVYFISSCATDYQGPKGIFVSIDGLNPQYMKTMNQAKQFKTETGFSWLLKDSLFSENAKPVITTLTASSHVSTITCTPPSRHGIVANGFIHNGESVSGFTTPFKTEPMWIAAKKQGLKVLALAYVGADGDTEKRTADFGLAYPEREYNSKYQIVELDPTTPTPITLILNPSTNEEKSAFLYLNNKGEVILDTNGNESDGKITNITNDHMAKINFVESDQKSPLFGFKRNFLAVQLPPEKGANTKVYISGSSYNKAYPESFRKLLDDNNLVWPAYGIKGKDLPVSLMIEGQSEIDKFLTSVAALAVPQLQPDIVLFYQPLIDSIGHKFEGLLPQPFKPSNNDKITRTYVEAYKTIDQNMSNLFKLAKSRTVVSLMGDHGMDPIKQMVNIAALLPEDMRSKVSIKTSGSQAMLYPTEGVDTNQVATILNSKLKALKFEGLPVLGKLYNSKKFSKSPTKDYNKEWQYGQAEWAYLNAQGFWFTFKKDNSEVFMTPPAYGMHGHSHSIKSMSTGYYLKGAKTQRSKELKEFSLIDATPTFMRAINAKPPKDCLGRSVIR